jgi:hypothetical protein
MHTKYADIPAESRSTAADIENDIGRADEWSISVSMIADEKTAVTKCAWHDRYIGCSPTRYVACWLWFGARYCVLYMLCHNHSLLYLLASHVPH